MPANAPQTSSQKEYIKVANAPGLYRHVKTGRYRDVKRINGNRREHSLGTCDHKIAARRYRDWVASLSKIDFEVERTTLAELVRKFEEGIRSPSPKTVSSPRCRSSPGHSP